MCCVALSSTGFIIPQRVVLSIMGFLAIVNAYTMRICLSVAITEMVAKKTSNGTGDSKNQFCEADDIGHNDSAGGSFEWSENLQGIILGAFFWGYVSCYGKNAFQYA